LRCGGEGGEKRGNIDREIENYLAARPNYSLDDPAVNFTTEDFRGILSKSRQRAKSKENRANGRDKGV